MVSDPEGLTPTRRVLARPPVIPIISPGATDSSYLRNAGIPAYGHSGLADDVDDFRAHGKDERVPVKSFHDGHEYLYRLVKMLAGGAKQSFRAGATLGQRPLRPLSMPCCQTPAHGTVKLTDAVEKGLTEVPRPAHIGKDSEAAAWGGRTILEPQQTETGFYPLTISSVLRARFSTVSTRSSSSRRFVSRPRRGLGVGVRCRLTDS